MEACLLQRKDQKHVWCQNAKIDQSPGNVTATDCQSQHKGHTCRIRLHVKVSLIHSNEWLCASYRPLSTVYDTHVISVC